MKKYIIITLLSLQAFASENNHVDLTHISNRAQDSQESLSLELTAYLSFSLRDIPFVESESTTPVNNDSFCVSVISYVDPTNIEILDERNMMGNEHLEILDERNMMGNEQYNK